jgi:hypothetical protein
MWGMSRKRVNKVKAVRIALCTFRVPLLHLTLGPGNSFSSVSQPPPQRKSPRKTEQIGRERPHYLAVNPPKSFVWVAPACCKHQCHDKSVINQAVAPLAPCPSRTREKDRIP